MRLDACAVQGKNSCSNLTCRTVRSDQGRMVLCAAVASIQLDRALKLLSTFKEDAISRQERDGVDLVDSLPRAFDREAGIVVVS